MLVVSDVSPCEYRSCSITINLIKLASISAKSVNSCSLSVPSWFPELSRILFCDVSICSVSTFWVLFISTASLNGVFLIFLGLVLRVAVWPQSSFFWQYLVFYKQLENSKTIFIPCRSSRESTSPHIFINLITLRLNNFSSSSIHSLNILWITVKWSSSFR